MDDKSQARTNVLEATMLALSYIESRFYGDGSVADNIEATVPIESLFYGLAGVGNVFVMHTSELSGNPTQKVIADLRENIVELITEAQKGDSPYFE
jgi:hypothetical protein